MVWEKLGEYSLYLVPGYGVYKEWKKPKSKRSVLGTIGFSLYASGFAIKLILLPAFIGKGVATGNWNPFKIKTEQVEEIPTVKKINLEEKTKYFNDSKLRNL